MNPISEFFVEFTSKGFAELNEKLDNLSKRLDGLDGNFNKAGKASDTFIAGFAKWAKAAGVIAAVYKGLKQTFDISKDIRALYKSSDMLGVDPETLEKWTLVARLHSGNQGDVTSFFSGLNETARNLREGKYSPELMERMARYGFSEQYLYGASLPENRDKIIRDLNRLLNRKDLDAADIQALQSVFPGLNDTMVSILKTLPKDLAAELAWADRNRALSKDPKAIEQATALNKASIELSNAFKGAFAPLQGPLARLIEALQPLAEPLRYLIEGIAKLLEYLTPIVAWVIKKLSGSAAMAFEGVKALMSGSMDEINAWNKKYLQPGMGGWLGSAFRTFDTASTAVGEGAANLVFGDPNDVIIDLDSMPTASTGTQATSQTNPRFNADLNARIDLFNNGVKAEQMQWGTYIDPYTGKQLGTAAWAGSVNTGGV